MEAGGSLPYLWLLGDVEEAQVSVVVLFLYLPTSRPLFLSHHAWRSCVPGLLTVEEKTSDSQTFSQQGRA